MFSSSLCHLQLERFFSYRALKKVIVANSFYLLRSFNSGSYLQA